MYASHEVPMWKLAVEDPVSRLGERPFPGFNGDADRAERAEDTVEERQAAHDEPLLRVQGAAGARAGRREGF